MGIEREAILGREFVGGYSGMVSVNSSALLVVVEKTCRYQPVAVLMYLHAYE